MQTDSFCSFSLRGEKFAHIYSGKRIYSFKWFLSVQHLRIWWRSLTVWRWINLAKDWQRRFNFCTLIRYIVFHLWRQKMLQRCQKSCFCNQLRYFRFGSIHNLLECRKQILLKEMACKRRSWVEQKRGKSVAVCEIFKIHVQKSSIEDPCTICLSVFNRFCWKKWRAKGVPG